MAVKFEPKQEKQVKPITTFIRSAVVLYLKQFDEDPLKNNRIVTQVVDRYDSCEMEITTLITPKDRRKSDN